MLPVGNTGLTGAPLMGAWLPAVIAKGQSLGYGSISVVKIFHVYDSNSGTTHEDGLAADVVPTSHIVEWVQLFRQEGAAAWPRGAAWYTPRYTFHIHLQLNADDPKQIGRWQIIEGINGLNGIGDGGHDVVNPRYAGVKAIDGISSLNNPPVPAPPLREEDLTMYRWTNRGAVWAASLATGAFWHVPGGTAESADYDDILRWFPGTHDMGAIDDRHHDVIKLFCIYTRASIKAA